MERPFLPCSDEAWYKVLKAFDHSQAERINVDREALNEVLSCHQHHHPGYSIGRLCFGTPPPRAQLVPVRRDALFELIKDHEPRKLIRH